MLKTVAFLKATPSVFITSLLEQAQFHIQIAPSKCFQFQLASFLSQRTLPTPICLFVKGIIFYVCTSSAGEYYFVAAWQYKTFYVSTAWNLLSFFILCFRLYQKS